VSLESLDQVTFDPEQLATVAAMGNCKSLYGSPPSRYQRYKIPVLAALFRLVGDTKPCATHGSVQGRLQDPRAIRVFIRSMDSLSATLPGPASPVWESVEFALAPGRINRIEEQDAADCVGDWGRYEGVHSAVRKLIAARSARDALAALPQDRLGAVREATQNQELLGRIVRRYQGHRLMPVDAAL